MQYGLIGEHLTHSYSCEIHHEIADYEYELQELRPEEVAPFLKKREFSGINVTIPYKETVMPYLDHISDEAKLIGSVNTIVNRQGKLYGYNTDLFGMTSLIRHLGVRLSNKKVLILGTGGTAKTAAVAARILNAKRIEFASRTAGKGKLTYQEAYEKYSDAQILINATPVGMYPHDNESPVLLSAFDQLEGIIDAVYHPLRTELVSKGLQLGIPSEGGLYMLAAQAVEASALFTGSEASPELIEKAYRSVLKKKQNIVLIGMPTSGKSTVGKMLADERGCTFIDTDMLFTEKKGMTPAEYLKEHSEKAFRMLESSVIREAAKESGAVIATGGGAVLSQENVKALGRNGVIVFLNRPFEKLAADDNHPLSADREALKRLYDERLSLYKAAADVIVNKDAEPSVLAADILTRLSPAE